MDNRHFDQPCFSGDYQLYRERNNASWERSRHENASSARSEPTNFLVLQNVNFPTIHHKTIPEALSEQNLINNQQIENGNQCQDDLIIEEIEEPQELVQVEPIPSIYCFECDALIDENHEILHNSESCEREKCVKFICECGQMFNFERNFKIHRIVEHFLATHMTGSAECIFCPPEKRQVFTRYSAYIGHVKLHLTSDTVLCKTCGMEFDDEKTLKKHHRQEHQPIDELSYCPKCQQIIPLEETLVHSQIHSTHEKIEKKPSTSLRNVKGQNRNYACEECGKSFVRPSELKRHEEVHRRKKEEFEKWECAICQKSYAHRTGLYEHKRIAHGEGKRHICQICGVTFTKTSNLKRHVKTIHPLDEEENRSEKERFDCPDCPSVLYTSGAYSSHRKRVHNETNLVPLKKVLEIDKHICKICKREYGSESMLRKHQKFHLLVEKKVKLEKEHECKSCDKSYRLHASLNFHNREHFFSQQHEQQQNSKFPFSNRAEFKLHTNEHHSLECENCRQSFASRNDYANHACRWRQFVKKPLQLTAGASKTKVMICRLCDPPLRLTTLRQINEHKGKHQPRKLHLCWTCHKSFRTAQLLNLHRGVHSLQRIQCEHCDATFHNRIVLKQHVKSIHSQENGYQCVVQVDRNAAMSVQSFAEYGLANEHPDETTRAQSVVDWMEQEQHEMTDEAGPIAVRDGPVRCEVCKHSFNNLESLCEHWHENESERDHSFSVVACPVCQLRIGAAAATASHLRNEHFFRKPRELTFISSKNVENRERYHQEIAVPVESRKGARTASSNQKMHTCTYCQKGFKKKCDLVRHVRMHTGEKPFQCPVCSLCFRVKSTLTYHMLVHSENAPAHECMICKKLFLSRKSLIVHMRIHTGETPIKCKFCDMCFRTPTMAMSHEKACSRRNDVYEFQQVVVNGAGGPSTAYKSIECYVNDEMNRTIEQITTMPATDLKISSSSAFDAVQSGGNGDDNVIIHVITKPIGSTDYAIIIQYQAPLVGSIREQIDTVSAIPIGQLRATESVTVVLHNNMRLTINTPRMLEMIQNMSGVLKTKVRLGEPQSHDTFEVVEYQNVSFARRCEICEVDFETKQQSDEHFYSEDHETAQLMYPMINATERQGAQGMMLMMNRNPMEVASFAIQSQDNTSDFNCKLCGRKFLDMEPLMAHIRKEHDRQADTVIPPRPTAHTAPIH